jgi:hypothetical protein
LEDDLGGCGCECCFLLWLSNRSMRRAISVKSIDRHSTLGKTATNSDNSSKAK